MRCGNWSCVVWCSGVLAACLCGCALRPAHSPLANATFRADNGPLNELGRVALVDLDNASRYTEIAVDVSKGLFVALQRKQYFGITRIAQNDPQWKGLLLEADGSYAAEELVRMRQSLRCDAVLSGVVTEYKPYPHLTLGLRLNLVDVRDGALLWGIENVWRAADLEGTRIAAYLKAMPGKKALQSEILRLSSSEFIDFVAYEIAATLSE